MRAFRVPLVALLCHLPALAAAQLPTDSTPSDECAGVFDSPLPEPDPVPGARTVCDADVRPVPLAGNPMPQLPRYPGRYQGTMRLTVEPDGSVRAARRLHEWASAFRGAHVSPRDLAPPLELLPVVARWRFRPGEYEGRPVRVALMLEVRVEAQPHDGPSRVAWRYVQGRGADSLVATWEPLPPLPALSRVERDAVTLAAMRALADSGAVREGERYCVDVEPDSTDGAASEAAAASIAERVRALLQRRGVRAEARSACGPGRGRVLAITRVHQPLPDFGVVAFSVAVEAYGPREHPNPQWTAECHVERARGRWAPRCTASHLYLAQLREAARIDEERRAEEARCPPPPEVTPLHAPRALRQALEGHLRASRQEFEALERRRGVVPRGEYDAGAAAYRQARQAYEAGMSLARASCERVPNAILALDVRPGDPGRADVLLLTVTYWYTGDHGDEVSTGAITMKDGASTGHWAYRPVRLSRGLHTATIRLGMNGDSPDRYASDAVEVTLYVHGRGSFAERTFPLAHTWVRSPP